MRIIIPLGIVALGLMIYSAVECLQTPRERVRVLGKWSWFAVILLVPLIGAGLWLAFGRARRDSGGSAGRRPAAPDDDPNFLRGLEIQRRQRQRQEEERRRGTEDRRGAAPSDPADASTLEGPPADDSPADEDPPSEEQDALADADAPEVDGGDAAEDSAHDSSHDGETGEQQTGEDRPPRTGYRDDVDPDEELDPDDPRLDDGGTGTDRPR